MTPQPVVLPRRDLAAMRERALRARGHIAPRPRAARPARRIGLWLPTTAIFALLAPFALLALPFLYLAPRAVLPRPAAALFGVGALFFSLSGTQVEVDRPDVRIRLHLI
jgi:hypothetical protein